MQVIEQEKESINKILKQINAVIQEESPEQNNHDKEIANQKSN